MSNEFYAHGSYPTTGSLATSAALRAELDLITTGFDKLPTMAGNGSKVLRVNASASALEAFSIAKGDVGLGNVSNDAQLKIASNLSDLNNAGTARTNLGLGDSATKSVGTTAGTVAAGDHNHSGVYEPVISKSTGTLTWNGSAWAWDTNTYLTTASASSTYLTTASAASTYEPAISKSTGFLKWNGSAWAWDTSTYLTTSAGSSTYEPVITAGTTAQYWRGDKSWQALNASAVGLGSVENTALSTWAGTSNITTLGTVSTGTWSATAIAVNKGGTGLTSGTSGGVLYYSASGTLASSAALAANALVVGGGAGVAPSTVTTGTGVVTALGVNTGTSGAFVVNGGALGTPSSGTLTNCTFPTLNQNTTGSAATFTSTTQNSQFNSIGVNTSASGTAGEIRATNNITAYYSDSRLKDRISVIDNALAKVRQLTGFLYRNNALAATFGYDSQEVQVGLSAQDALRVQPEAVAPAPFDMDENNQSKSGENYLTIRYERLVPLLVEAIKELAGEVDYIKARM